MQYLELRAAGGVAGGVAAEVAAQQARPRWRRFPLEHQGPAGRQMAGRRSPESPQPHPQPGPRWRCRRRPVCTAGWSPAAPTPAAASPPGGGAGRPRPSPGSSSAACAPGSWSTRRSPERTQGGIKRSVSACHSCKKAKASTARSLRWGYSLHCMPGHHMTHATHTAGDTS